jgi:23S rRNA (pseudouridine1915-N3)-methyltransferase
MAYTLYINSKKISPSTTKAVNEYIKRLSPYCKMSVKPVTSIPSDISSGYNIYITSDKSAPTLSSEDFAKKINHLAVDGLSKINLFIGYSEEAALWNESFCLSHIELSPEILLIALSEQIYRGYTINNNITYHK